MKKVLKKFGKYLLLDRLAQGGMAEIFRAWAPSVDGGGRLIVLKCVQPNYGEDPEFLQMFRSEIRVTMGLNHPNIVQLYDFGEIDGHPYIAMELVDGKNLKQFISRVQQTGERMAPEIAAIIISQAAAGLHYAHTYKDRTTGEPLDIIHRDVSPQNLLLSYSGNVKIIDFGIAKAASNRQETRAGIIKGKPSYLSPEQIEGLELDGRSDVFSLGAVLWETLTGKKLFTGDSDLAAIRMIEECDTSVKPPSVINKIIPTELDAIVLRSLAKDRNQRFKSAEEMYRALHRFVYAYKPDFDPSIFGKYLQELFSAEIEEEQRTIRQLNAEAKELFEKVEESKARADGEPASELQSEKREKSKTFAAPSLEGVDIDMASNPGIKVLQNKPGQINYSAGTRAQTPKASSGKGGAGGKFIIPLLLIGAAVYFAPQLMPKKDDSAPETQTTPQAHPVAAAQNIPLRLDVIPMGGQTQILINQQAIDPSRVRIPIGAKLKISVVKPGFKPFERDLVASAGLTELQMQAVLEPLNSGNLTLHTTPSAEAKILSDTLVWTRRTPIENLKLPPGIYQVHLVNQLLGMKKDLQVEILPEKNTITDVNLDVVR